MAQFRATIQGGRGGVSRLGHKTTGITANVNGWGAGVQVRAQWGGEETGDIFAVYVTGGSRAQKMPEYIGSVNKDGVFVPCDKKFQGGKI